MKYPTQVEIEAIYAARDAAVAGLSAKQTIEPADLTGLDRLGRFKVAAELWAQCSEQTRQGLLHDEHHCVRSAAVLARAAESDTAQ